VCLFFLPQALGEIAIGPADPARGRHAPDFSLFSCIKFSLGNEGNAQSHIRLAGVPKRGGHVGMPHAASEFWKHSL